MFLPGHDFPALRCAQGQGLCSKRAIAEAGAVPSVAPETDRPIGFVIGGAFSSWADCRSRLPKGPARGEFSASLEIAYEFTLAEVSTFTSFGSPHEIEHLKYAVRRQIKSNFAPRHLLCRLRGLTRFFRDGRPERSRLASAPGIHLYRPHDRTTFCPLSFSTRTRRRQARPPLPNFAGVIRAWPLPFR